MTAKHSSYTQAQIAEMSGVSKKTVWTALNKPEDVKNSTLQKIEEALKTDSASPLLMLSIEKWADEIERVCKKYSGEDWGFEYKATEGGFVFKGFVGVPVKREGKRGKQ